jgi:hypothetical protein
MEDIALEKLKRFIKEKRKIKWKEFNTIKM